MPATDVATWAGHGVEVLLRIYAGCIDEHEAIWIRRMDDTLNAVPPPNDDRPDEAK